LVVLVALYLLLCLLVGLCGRKRRTGFGGTFALALLLTPPVMLLILWLTAGKSPVAVGPATAPAGAAFRRRAASAAPDSCTCGCGGSERNA
jgi:hypothetical protein